LVDDVLDYRGESGRLGKNTGDDLREGKMTLPVILALAAANPAEREELAALLGNAKAGEAELKRVVAIFSRHQALERSIEQASEHARRAREALKPLPHSEMKLLLGEIAEFTVARVY